MTIDRNDIDRRQFLAGASAAALMAAHGRPSRAASGSPSRSRGTGGADDPRILRLRLRTAAPLAAMRDFYQGALGLRVVAEGPRELTVAAGASRITFADAGPDDGEPFYHVAFNVPENQLLAAREWQLERTPIIPPYEGLRDPDFPDDVVWFRNWNAHSVFFWDPAGNLLEHIARHDLANGAAGPFSSDDLLYVSEIAFIVDDVDAVAAGLQESFELRQYRHGGDAFRAVGDEHGLLLVMQRGRMLGFGEARPADVFPTAAGIRGSGTTRYAVSGFPYEISAE